LVAMLEIATTVLALLVVLFGFELWKRSQRPPEIQIETVVETIEDTERLLALTQELATAKQSVRFHEGAIDELSHQVARLQLDLESTQVEAKKQKGRAASAHTSKGQILEKWAPFVEHPQIDPDWKAENWNFMGNPIDYIVWDYRDDKDKNVEEGMVYIMDVKSAKAQLSTKQRRIRDLVKAGRVEWREIRLD